ncbi:MAG: SRPBCC family protein [Bacteroidota bacterium]
MSRYEVVASAHIHALAARIYSILKDYRNGHPHILPQQYFRSLEVQQGGVGAGTVIRFQMRVMGSTRTFTSTISEPEPGRVLAETDADSGVVTKFTVDPDPQAQGSVVTIQTELNARKGIGGSIERFMTTRLLRRIYSEELQLIEEVVTQEPSQA